MRFVHISLSASYGSLLRPHLFEDQIRLVWEEILECVHRLRQTITSADFWVAFWFFVVVSLIISLQSRSFSDRCFQNRYFPIIYQFWQLAGWCAPSLPSEL